MTPSLPPELAGALDAPPPTGEFDIERSKAHATAAALRVPIFKRGLDAPAPREKLAALEEFMLVSAYWSGDCHEERLEAYEELAVLELEWDELRGWEQLRRGSTQKSADEAKRALRPDLHRQIAARRFRVDRLTEEIVRLEADATKVSRAYTILSG